MAQGLVDDREAIEIEIEQREGAAVPLEAIESLGQAGMEPIAVHQPRQPIVLGHMVDLALARLQRGHRAVV